MKLNPPASSSDLEKARQIARRLHQHRRRDDPGATSWPSEEAPVRPRLSPPPLPPRTAAPPTRETRGRPEPPTARREPEATFNLPEAPPFERPSWREPGAFAPEPESLEDLAGPPAEPSLFAVGEPQLTLEPALPDVDVDEPPLSPEEMVGEAEASPLDALTDSEASPFDDALIDASPSEEPVPPAWDQIVETCRGLAQARGAMLVDPAGQVFSTRGDWPAPGPEAIATKLVAMMAKTLKDAPTRSISAPLMGMHLTAWRVPLREGLVTAVFIGAAPVRADARPAIDNEIQRGV